MSSTETLFAIPHIVTSISKDLTPNELALCLQVCHAWHSSFLYEINRRDNPAHYAQDHFCIPPGTDCRLVSRNPSRSLTREQILTMNREQDFHHGHDSRLKDNGGRFFGPLDSPFLYPPATIDSPSEQQQILRDRFHQCCLPLVTLKITQQEQHPLCQQRQKRRSDSILAKTLSCLPPWIQDLDIHLYDLYNQAQHRLRFATTGVEDGNDDDDDDGYGDGVVNTGLGSSSVPQTRRSLSSLSIHTRYLGQNHQCLLWFLAQCPNLKRFSCVTILDAEPMPSFDLRVCPQLESLFLVGRANTDRVRETLDLISSPLKSLTLIETTTSLPICPLSPAIDRHFPTLERAWLAIGPISGEDILTYLKNCPRLREFLVIPAPVMGMNGWLNLEDMMITTSVESMTSWKCLGLKSLRLPMTHERRKRGQISSLSSSVQESIHEDHQHPLFSADYAHSCPRVLETYFQISRLVQLETLVLSISHFVPGTDEEKNNQSLQHPHSVTKLYLDFSIESGLPILAPLIKLKKIGFHSMQPTPSPPLLGIQQPELEWMVEHWPDLREIEIKPSREIVATCQDIASEEHWLWLKVHHPEIRVSFK
ncbi:hypothetical protein BGZ83_000028 [Gryganskiella cystojenkinii]|nr:hypothetical protein BGZ83_000028 [Gryganskiella cystojenkinii]